MECVLMPHTAGGWWLLIARLGTVGPLAGEIFMPPASSIIITYCCVFLAGLTRKILISEIKCHIYDAYLVMDLESGVPHAVRLSF